MKHIDQFLPFQPSPRKPVPRLLALLFETEPSVIDLALYEEMLAAEIAEAAETADAPEAAETTEAAEAVDENGPAEVSRPHVHSRKTFV